MQNACRAALHATSHLVGRPATWRTPSARMQQLETPTQPGTSTHRKKKRCVSLAELHKTSKTHTSLGRVSLRRTRTCTFLVRDTWTMSIRAIVQLHLRQSEEHKPAQKKKEERDGRTSARSELATQAAKSLLERGFTLQHGAWRRTGR